MADPTGTAPDDLVALSDTLSAMAATVLGAETLTATLDLVISLAVAALPDASGASVTLAATRQLQTISATSDTVREIDAIQYESGLGPCVEASATGVAQHATGSDIAARWPEFGAALAHQQISSMLSLPLSVPDRTIGALNLYGGTGQDSFDEPAVRMATVFARHASAVLANAASLAEKEATNTHLMEALATRQTIGQAMGIIIAREHCSSDDAFDILRRASQRSNRKLRDIAAEIVHAAEQAR